MDDLSEDMQKLLAHSDLQERYTLFRHSFIKKPLHLFRTMSPHYTAEFIEGWEIMKQLILCSIIGCKIDNWTQLYNEVAQLPVEDGGLGIENHRIIRFSAYVASLIDYNRRSCKIIPENVDLATVSEDSFLDQFIDSCQDFLNVNDEEHPWKSVYDLLKIEGKVGSTVQNQLTKYRFTKFRNAIEADIRNESIHWFTWHKGHGGDSQAGHWLNVIPKYQKFYMDPLDFRTAIRHYMFFKVDKFVEGQTCICRHHPTLDPYGHHLGSGCLNGGFTINTHNDLVRELNSILRYAGYHTKLEETGIFTNIIPNHRLSAEEQSGLRPDISINNFSPFEAKLCLDLTVRSTLTYNVHAMPNVIPPDVQGKVGIQADKGFEFKMMKYKAVCQANRFSFLPIVFESNGYAHPETVKFIRQLASDCAPIRRIPEEVLFKFFMKGLSAVLHRSIARSIQHKIPRLNVQGPIDGAFHHILEEE